MRRRTGDETRALLLKVGLQMLFERGAAAGVQHIRLQDVLRRAGLTTGAAYRLWADQTDYQRDLAVAMVRLRLASPVEGAASAVGELVARRAPLDDVIRAAAETHVAGATRAAGDRCARDAQAFLIALALRATATTWPELREASRQRHEESIAEFARFYGRLMGVYGYRMRAPLTLEHFTAAMAALGEGFAIHALEGLDHPVVEIAEGHDLPSGRWTLFAVAVRGLMAAFMEPDPCAAPVDAGPARETDPGPHEATSGAVLV
ncbi:hypothetical protein [Microbacterium sp. MEC084]|uniref:hypothetical protein n=1 Tax=Microbacterium sp. MEC084 TaxID=1963027 RepID=UPI00197C65F8|nr:hypothetical protein [Microbacterium sp. MEC084]